MNRRPGISLAAERRAVRVVAEAMCKRVSLSTGQTCPCKRGDSCLAIDRNAEVAAAIVKALSRARLL